MNFKNALLSLFALTLLVLIGCGKESIHTSDDQATTIEGFLTYSLNKNDLQKNELDAEDASNNEKLIDIAEKFKQVVADKTLAKAILDMANENDRGYVSLTTLIKTYPSIAAHYDANQSYLMPYQGTMHEAVINIPNIKIADASANPLVSPGLEVEDNPSKGMNDFIFSWMMDNDQNFVEIALGEKQAMEMNNPFFVVTPHPIGDNRVSSITPVMIPQATDNETNARSTPYHFDQLRVNHRYEKSGKSEIWIQNYRIDENGTHHWLPNSGGADGKRQLAELSKNDIGVTQNVNIGFLDPNGSQQNVTPASSNAAFFAVWERDWYSSSKDLGKMCYNSTSLFFGGKRKYSSEWYSYDPNENDSSCSSNTTIQESQLNFTQSMQTFNFQNGKGHLRLDFN